MITPQKAEEIAKQAVADYLSECLDDQLHKTVEASHIGDLLMKLASVAGVMMANAEGSTVAYQRLYGTAVFVARNMPETPAQLGPTQ